MVKGVSGFAQGLARALKLGSDKGPFPAAAPEPVTRDLETIKRGLKADLAPRCSGVTLADSADMVPVGDGGSPGEGGVDLRLVSHDPWLSFTLDAETAAASPLGELKITAAAGGDRDRLYGKVYFSLGRGFSEADTVPLTLGEGASASVFVARPDTVGLLRWDPHDGPGEVLIESIAFTPVLDREDLARRAAAAAGRSLRPAGLLDAVDAIGARALAGEAEGADHAFALTRALALACAGGQDGGGSRGDAATRDFYRLSDGEVEALRRAAQAMTDPPVVSVVMPVYRTDPALLREAVDSVRRQIYPHWQLCIADDCSQDPALTALLDEMAAEDARIRVVHRERNGHISAASNSALELATGAWIALLDHDDLLTPDALLRVVQAARADPAVWVVYSDEDKIESDGRRRDGFHKPDFSIELFRSQNYLNHLTAVRADAVRAVGGWRLGFEGSQDHDLLLRVLDHGDDGGPSRVAHIPRILYHWRLSAGSTAISGDEKGYAFMAGLRALEDHLARRGLDGHVEKTPRLPYYRMRLEVPEPPPRVTLLIPTRDRSEILDLCVSSILEKTDYPNYEIMIIDNGSVEDKTRALFARVQRDPRVKVVPFDAPFNFSSINNFGVSQTDAPLVAMVNNDIEVISPAWLTEMVSWTVQPDVGCVGAKLYYPDDSIQHAGVIVGLGGVAGHSHKHFPRDHLGYFGRLIVVQDLTAVTAACLLVRRSIFLEVGGLNEADLSVAFNDVDFCMKVRRAGYRNVFTPFAELYHHESASRGAEDDPRKVARFNGEIDYMKRTWGETLLHDPFYSPHLTLDREDFSLR